MRSAILRTPSLCQYLSLFIKVITPITLVAIRCFHWTLSNRILIYPNSRYKYLILKFKKAATKRKKTKVSPLLFTLIKCMVLSQSNLLDNKYKNEINEINGLALMDKLSLDLRADHYELYAIHIMQFNKNQYCFSRLFLLLSGDIEYNPRPFRIPCIICTGSVSKRDFFA